MTKDKFLSFLSNTDELTIEHISELKEMAEQYPYFAPTHLLLAKALHLANDIQKDYYLKKASIYAANNKHLFFLLNPTKARLAEPKKSTRENKRSGDYFEMIEKVESVGGDAKQSLKSLAQRLKAARQSIQIPLEPELKKEESKVIRFVTPDYFDPKNVYAAENNLNEELAKNLIKLKKYNEAIVILRQLNLIYPKKSIYFADQIRFLEKILVNTKK